MRRPEPPVPAENSEDERLTWNKGDLVLLNPEDNEPTVPNKKAKVVLHLMPDGELVEGDDTGADQ